MVRPAKTRFATAFLTLARFHVHKAALRKMFTSQEFNDSSYAKEQAAKITLMPSFWNHIVYSLKVDGPLVKVLRLVDGEKKPPMGYIYEAMDRAKEAIAASFKGNKDKTKEIFEIIDRRWDIQLHRPLHATGHFLNPEFFYSNPGIERDKEVMTGLYNYIERLVPTIEEQDKVCAELPIYTKGEGIFNLPMAKRQRSTRAPADWWASYGSSAPSLQKFAIRILSLTCNSSGCKRNWSVFEHLHSKRRNRLEQKCLNDLVFIKYNRQLRRRYNMRDTIDPISLDEIDESNEWLIRMPNENAEDDFVFEDTDLTWGDYARASGIEDCSYPLRSQSMRATVASKRKEKEFASSSTPFKLTDDDLNVINLDEIEEEDVEGYKSDNNENDDIELFDVDD